MFFSIIFNTLPFKSVKKQVIYTENEYNEHINRYIQCNYTSICQYFAQQGYEFCYLPFLARELSADNIISYYAPFATKIQSCDISNDFLLQYMANPQNRTKISPSLLYFSHSEDNVDIYSGIKLDDTSFFEGNDWANVLQQIENDISSNSKKGPRIFCRISFSFIDDFFNDENFDEKTRELLLEFNKQAEALKKRGISTYILEQIINKPPMLSKMVITSDYRILLPDYNNKEIDMTPLVKAVYLLFLRHPEGITFKYLTDYREELIEIYKKIKGNRWIFTQINSINDVTNPLSNSINEKCARIKGAFITQFNENLAQYYIITGERGEPKRIILPQELVIWE